MGKMLGLIVMLPGYALWTLLRVFYVVLPMGCLYHLTLNRLAGEKG